MALLQRAPAPQTLISPIRDAPIRRCTFRRITAVPQRRGMPLYDVACMYPSRESPIPLGDIESAKPICDSCTAPGIFRPDED